MKASALFLTALVGTGCSIPADKREIIELRQKNAELQQKLEGIELQEKCAKLAERTFVSMPKEPGINYDYTCHYNKHLNKFFINVVTFSYKDATTSKMIIDLLENKTIATYLWKPDKVKKYWEVRPLYCSVYDEPKNWSTEEYNTFEKSCMSE